jgi:hypothetical protein
MATKTSDKLINTNNKMKSSLGSEVLLRIETLSEDKYAVINLLRASEIT